MEALKRARRLVRREFETLHRELESLLKEDVIREDAVAVKFKMLTDANDNLQPHDNKIIEELLKEDLTEEEENKELDNIREWKSKFETIRIQKEKRLPVRTMDTTESIAGGSVTMERIRNFKLPTVQVRKFSGELLDWLPFWAQFQKIDDDVHMHGSDKFWYLLQSLQPNTDAYEIAAGYPQSNENYPKVIAALKKRYGQEDVLLQVYIRQLLNLVISNVNAKEKIPVKNLYLKLDSHIRALKTLNLEKADPATWLFPLVESSLPDRILDNWQRSPLCSHDGSQDNPPRNRLDLLMEFVEREVEINQRIDLAKSFNVEQKSAVARPEPKAEAKMNKKFNAFQKPDKRGNVSTLSAFHTADIRKCIFCEKTNHKSDDCFRGKEMTYQERMDILRKKDRCFRCGGTHVAKNCQTENLECKVCQRRHLTILCRDFKRKRDMEAEPAATVKRARFQQDSNKIVGNHANLECTGEVLLQTLLVKVAHRNKEEIVRAFIDGGSQRSYILKKTARKLKLEPSGVERVVHSLFGGATTETVAHNVYKVNVHSMENDFHDKVEVREQDKICIGIPKLGRQQSELFKELRQKKVELTDAEVGPSEIGLLIGADLYSKWLTGRTEKLQCGAVAIHTNLGWTVLGVVNENLTKECLSFSNLSVTQLWDLETLGIKDPASEKEINKKQEMVMENYVKNISRAEDGRYIVKLPWKEDHPQLLSNKEIAYKRLQSTTKKLVDKGLLGSYHGIFEAWEEEGFIERVSTTDDSNNVHLLPHRPVIKPESITTPVRPVFDASCHSGKSPSLNNCLYTGESYVQLIPEILLRFREKKVGFVSDIRKAFQMIAVHNEDRDMLRFLWWEDLTMKNLVEFRHARVLFGATCSPFILSTVLRLHLATLPEKEKKFGEKLMSTFYVDNCVHSLDDCREYAKFKDEATSTLRNAAMDLRMWLSNVDEEIEEPNQVISVLGLQWDRKTDELFVNVKGITVPHVVTKRVILSTIQRIFDTIGFTAPCVLPMKLLLQKAWLNKTKWDEELPEEESNTFLKWCEEATQMDKIRIPRLSTMGITDRSGWSLHIFTDSSTTAYSAAIFLRVQHANGVSVQLLAAKSRVAPVKKVTIPKLELMGCLLGVRLAVSVKKAMRLEGIAEFYWCDSTTADAWIRRNDQWGTFVGNRTKEINEFTRKEDWRHVPGKVNPADLPSRGCFPSVLMKTRWWEGPSWLYEEESSWPASSVEYNEEEIGAERKLTSTEKMVISFSVMDRVRNSYSFDKLVRIVGWSRRFLHNKFVKTDLRRQGELAKEEIESAKIALIRLIQTEEFSKEELGKLTNLEIFKDKNGILRVKTRLTYRDDPTSFRFPISLPGKREEVRQLVQDFHRMYCHAGVSFLTTKLRNKYWIVKARQTVKGVVNKCVSCRKLSSKNVVPEPAPLPLDRIKDAEVFEVVGVDLAGPLLMKGGMKMWLVIFTCGVYRAVHFELVKKVSTAAFITALENFTEKYRRPSIIYSDNGTNFKGTDNLFKKIDWSKVEGDKRMKKIEFKFNPATSSWWGGWWERLIRTAKDLMRRTIGKGSLHIKELKTLVKTIAEIMNSRPLTHVSENPADLEPLTPSLFLHPFGQATLPEAEITEAQQMRFRLNYVTTLRKELKQRFLKEYLSMLVNRNPKKITRELNEGELVLVGSDNQKRIDWPLGRVLELYAGKDGAVRVAKVKTEKGEITRSVQRLYPLELDVAKDTTEAVIQKGIVTRSGRRVKVPDRFL